MKSMGQQLRAARWLAERAKIERRIENVLVAQAMVLDLKPEQFTRGLSSWVESIPGLPTEKALRQHACGSAACFGGWCAIHPHFRAQGVARAFDGAPMMRSGGGSTDVAIHLFGASNMFWASIEHFNEKEQILNRLEWALAHLTRQQQELDEDPVSRPVVPGLRVRPATAAVVRRY